MHGTADNGRGTNRMSDDKPSLRGVHLTRTYGQGEIRTNALQDVSINLYRGQLALLMGPSGSGKSTLLAVLSGLLEPDSGQVLAAEEPGKYFDIWKLSAKERERYRLRTCGFIFQGYNLFPALTARQQLEIVLLWGGEANRREARKRADAMLEELGLLKQANKKPHLMSGGEKQRVAIGRALIKNPSFCFADEPTSALDWKHGEQVVELLRAAAHERRTTILIVSHDPRIEAYVDQVVRIEDGSLVDPMAAPGRALRSVSHD